MSQAKGRVEAGREMPGLVDSVCLEPSPEPLRGVLRGERQRELR